jgi:aerobic-type carbon monoxide dehydrogenase small subunit (CoxS/CutS family)
MDAGTLSCTVLALDAVGKDIHTIEAMVKGSHLHPLQEAFIKHGAFNVGYVPGG